MYINIYISIFKDQHSYNVKRLSILSISYTNINDYYNNSPPHAHFILFLTTFPRVESANFAGGYREGHAARTGVAGEPSTCGRKQVW